MNASSNKVIAWPAKIASLFPWCSAVPEDKNQNRGEHEQGQNEIEKNIEDQLKIIQFGF